MRKIIRKYIGDLFPTHRFYLVGSCCAAVFVLRFFLPWLGIIPYLLFLVFVFLFLFEYILLFFTHRGITASRILGSRLSNGDENTIVLYVQNRYLFPVRVEVIDEIPFQFQRRDIRFRVGLQKGEQKRISYFLRPVKRGRYGFGNINSYVSAFLGFIQKRYISMAEKEVAVYPSFIKIRQYQLLAINKRLNELGLKKQRRLGQGMEFEQISDYVPGDDYRKLNWKATARRGQLMVNSYMEEKSQPVYCVIDKGRLMEMPFNGLCLLDYAINASLMLSNLALNREDKAGLVTFSDTVGTILPADKKLSQMQSIQELLYRQRTRFRESSFEALYLAIRRRISQRSLLLLFTNFATLNGLHRQLPYLRKLSENHLLVVIFFRNSELTEMLEAPVEDLRDAYNRTVAEQFEQEKRKIVKELKQYGILSLLSTPEQLTINVLNRYLEIKARQQL